jgi:predicted metal-dependent peptidase
MGVEIAAISDQAQEIYFNPRVSVTLEEAKFVMAHELLHAGLRHSARRQGRDPWFWNVACDYVINDWLTEMQLGEAPDHVGYLHDVQLRGMSAEEVYDRIVSDLRWMRKLKKTRTMNGNKPDMLDGNNPPAWWHGGGVELDVFYRRALAEGLELHLGRGRGYLPAGLVEEIRAQMQPPIPWEVKLAHWLDQYFPPLEKRRTFARAHRRQSATPDIPRPAWINPDQQQASRVFGAVIDTSGSMSRSDLAKAVGAIASYAMSREVALVRLVQCDAAPHDAGYVHPEELLDRVQIKGRGGTVLMPGIKLLEDAKDFPKDGPILLITDGACDRLTIRRDHAILLADGGRLTQSVRGPVFRMTD